jgi:D-alanyl-D-alanine carboxypeptidase-like protein
MSRWVRVGGATLAGVLVGAVLTLGLQTSASRPLGGGTGRAALPALRAEAPETFLVWVPRGVPTGFAEAARRLPSVGAVTAVAEDDVWLRRSWSEAGEVIDDPAPTYRIPLDAAAVDPATFAPFVPPPDRASIAAVADGDGILGATSAALRGIGPGAILDFGYGERIRVAAVLPDELVGAAELMVSRQTGRRIGIRQERYLLLQPTPGTTLSTATLLEDLRPLLPTDLGVNRKVQVRAPGQTPYFRAGDAVLPPVLVKALFGEFAARPGRQAGTLEVDPSWIASHLVTQRVPVLGTVTCNRGIVAQLRSALLEVRAAGLRHTVDTFNGCFVSRFIGWDDSNMVSYHSWGIAFDLNLEGNFRGTPPHQDPRLVRILERWGFQWGGSWIVPDGSHFEYRRAA